MKKTLLFLCMISALALVSSCNDDEEGSYPPTYQGFRYEPSTVHPGDSVFITAVQLKKGHYLNSTDYSWSMTVQVDSAGIGVPYELYYSRHTNYGGLDSNNPQWRLELPGNTLPGTYSCQFNARFSNSADGIGGMFNGGTGEGCVGTINSQSYTLYSTANGSFRLIVK
ncbi:MAG: hypothetical protein IJ197_05930 [Bacteroidaceae bacterium]|nr:hypothetical protein [Bacteroidaceae bacterium]